jgi:hypothetical protein
MILMIMDLIFDIILNAILWKCDGDESKSWAVSDTGVIIVIGDGWMSSLQFLSSPLLSSPVIVTHSSWETTIQQVGTPAGRDLDMDWDQPCNQGDKDQPQNQTKTPTHEI